METNNDKQKSELDDILSDIDNSENIKKEDNIETVDSDALIYSFLLAIQGITQIVSEHTHLKSVALTDNDVNTLKTALKPFTEYILKLVNFIIYLPIITFAIGYTLRILTEIKQNKKQKNETITTNKPLTNNGDSTNVQSN